ncbi:MAG: hypothetical protein Q7J41_10970 [Acetobacterium sp.]|jgi:hypothetical protein|nr:hypothetical protein [Acetobacterium sp.]
MFSGTGKIAGVRLPDFTDVHVNTKKESGISDCEYEQAIVEQAIMDQKAGKFQNESVGFNKLAKKYVSEVSPDRSRIITEGLQKALKSDLDILKPIDWIALIFEGKVKYQKESDLVEYAEFYDGNGEMVAKYSNGGWTMLNTKAETGRQMEMCSIYNAAWGAAAKAGQEVNDGAADSKGNPNNTLDRLV